MQTVASSAQIVKFNFNLDSLQAVRDGNSVWFPLRPFCDALGLDPDAQRRRLQKQKWAVTVVMTATGIDGKIYEMYCVDRKTLLMALATVDASRVAEHVRPKLEIYQRDVADVIDRAFFPSAQADDQRIARLEAQVRDLESLVRLPQPAARQFPPRDDWMPRLAAYLADVPPAFQPTVGGILYDLGIQHVTRADQMRVARSLQSLGYARFYASGPKRCWKYRRAS